MFKRYVEDTICKRHIKEKVKKFQEGSIGARSNFDLGNWKHWQSAMVSYVHHEALGQYGEDKRRLQMVVASKIDPRGPGVPER